MTFIFPDILYLENRMKVKVLFTQSWLTLCDLMDYITHQAPKSMKFSRQE